MGAYLPPSVPGLERVVNDWEGYISANQELHWPYNDLILMATRQHIDPIVTSFWHHT